jgi:putative ABC transport system ATP-binding protein
MRSQPDPQSALVWLDEICKSYRMGDREVDVLHGVTLTVARGDFVAIMGQSGSGKSTLLNLIGLLDRPSSGLYALDGEDVATLDADTRAVLRSRRIGFVFQAYNLLSRQTAVENVELPLVYRAEPTDRRRRVAVDALAMVGLGHRAEHRPAQLSGGEQQRVALARAMVTDPDLLLADEPTGSVDSRSGLQIMALLQALHQRGQTIVMVTHDRDLARYAQRIVRIQDGNIANVSRVYLPRDAAGECRRQGLQAAGAAPQSAE